MAFRPLPLLTLVSALALAVLLGLGFWQLERLHWKRTIIAIAERNLHGRAQALDDGGIPRWEMETEYTRVQITGRFDNTKEAYVFGTGKDGGAIYHVIVPFRMMDGRVFLVDRGVVPKEKLDPHTRRAGLIGAVNTMIGVWRTPDGPGRFTPPPDLAHRIFYAHDLEAIAKLDGIKLLAPTVIEADALPNPGGWPKGGQTVIAFRNDHLQYAITWFGLAVVLVGVYVGYHASRGRLVFK